MSVVLMSAVACLRACSTASAMVGVDEQRGGASVGGTFAPIERDHPERHARPRYRHTWGWIRHRSPQPVRSARSWCCRSVSAPSSRWSRSFLIAAIAVQLLLDGLVQVGILASVPH